MFKLTCIADDEAPPQRGLRAEHGLSFLIESGTECVLFDTGGSSEVFGHNLRALGAPLEYLDAVVLSHGHNDHTGGLPFLLEARQGLPVYGHPDLGRGRFSRREGEMVSVGLPMPWEELERRAELRLSVESERVLTHAWTTGEISERPEPEGRSPGHMIRQGEGWTADPYHDDMALVLDTEPGLVLVLGCAHAGLLNTILHVRRLFARDPVAVVGGMHLAAASEEHLQRVLEVLQEVGPPMLYPNHCTGRTAIKALTAAFGEDRVVPCPAGTVLEF